ncbi:MAG: M20/M25/M40 family metallo-hydrolase, partial [Kangiella sp.]|nr:M20/M25/M40 family metallo-hydrolase [Kangiella sp.]
MDTQLAQAFIDKKWDDEIVPELVEYIKIPNKSPHFDPKWDEHGYMEQAVQQIANWCDAQDIPNKTLEIVRIKGRTPIIFMEIAASDGTNNPDDDTILMYGHLDKQPEMSGWEEGLGPWIPVIRDNKLYGRGGADDGYAAYASLTALMAIQ